MKKSICHFGKRESLAHRMGRNAAIQWSDKIIKTKDPSHYGTTTANQVNKYGFPSP